MEKIYVLDTNVLLSDPLAVYAFEENTVVIPTVVLQEVDNHKSRMDEVGRNAREFNRIMDSLRSGGNVTKGIRLPNGGKLEVKPSPENSSVYFTFRDSSNDVAIIALAKELHEFYKGRKRVVLISKDVSVRVRSDAVLVEAEDYLSDRVVDSSDSLYKGYKVKDVAKEEIDEIYGKGYVGSKEELPNEFVILKNGQSSAIARNVDGDLKLLYRGNFEHPIWGVRPKNSEQRMALELLLDPNVPVVTLSGKAGTGKTLLAIASALHQIEDEQKYKKLLVARPVVPMGRDIGYLPGEKEEKLRPWMQPIYDNLEYLFDCKGDPAELDRVLVGMGSIQVEALTYIQGKSIPEQFIIIDEAQNLTKQEAKTILTRVGEGSKIVLTGDTEQIDHPYLDTYSNGLTYVIEKLKDQQIAGHVTLSKGVRSTVAQICADIL